MKLRRWGPTAAYLTGCAAFLRFYWYSLNPDTLAYFSIAHHYLRGEWSEAANTGWSPMVSWLMVPLLALRLPDLAAMHLVTILAGVFTLYGVRKLAEEFELTPGWSEAAEYTAGGMLVAFALLRMGPDMLEAGLLLMYTRVVMRRDYGRPGDGFAAGAWGGAAFLTKGYALYFFLGHFAVVSLLHAWRQKDSRALVMRQWVGGMAVFGALSLPWLAVLSYRAGHFSTGTTGAWNYRLVGPNARIYPQFFGLIPPTSEHASSMWEEPNPELQPTWNPLASAQEMKHQLRLVFGNFRTLVTLLLYTSLFSWAAILGYAAWGLGRGDGARVPWIFPCVTLAVYPAGYLLILVGDRYLWNLFLLVLLMGTVGVQAASKGLARPGALLLGCGYFLSFLVIPARMMNSEANQAAWGPEAVQLQRQASGITGKLAACGGWNDGVQIAWMMQMPFYGVTGPTAEEAALGEQYNPRARELEPPRLPSDLEIGKQLEAYGVDYFLALPACKTLPSAVTGPPAAEWQGARLYRLRRQ